MKKIINWIISLFYKPFGKNTDSIKTNFDSKSTHEYGSSVG